MEKLKLTNKVALHSLIRRLIGLPLFILGVLLLLVHYFAHVHSNILMLIALILEVIGMVGHFTKIRSQK